MLYKFQSGARCIKLVFQYDRIEEMVTFVCSVGNMLECHIPSWFSLFQFLLWTWYRVFHSFPGEIEKRALFDRFSLDHYALHTCPWIYNMKIFDIGRRISSSWCLVLGGSPKNDITERIWNWCQWQGLGSFWFWG